MAAEAAACARELTATVKARMLAHKEEAAECISMLRKLGEPVEALQVDTLPVGMACMAGHCLASPWTACTVSSASLLPSFLHYEFQHILSGQSWVSRPAQPQHVRARVLCMGSACEQIMRPAVRCDPSVLQEDFLACMKLRMTHVLEEAEVVTAAMFAYSGLHRPQGRALIVLYSGSASWHVGLHSMQLVVLRAHYNNAVPCSHLPYAQPV